MNLTAKVRSRTRGRLFVLLALSVGMTAFGIDPANAVQSPTAPTLSQLDSAGAVTSTSPFTHVATVNGVTATTQITEPTAGTLRMTLDVAGMAFATTVVDNGNGTATYTTTGPNGYVSTEDRPLTVTSSSGCTDWSCLAAIGAGVVVTGAVCFFSAGLACAAAGTGSGAAAGAYCELHDCDAEVKCADHRVDAWNATNKYPGITGRAVHYQNAINCTHTMQYITMTTQLFKGSTPVFNAHTKSCYNANNCWDGYIAYNLPAGCYKAKGSFSARWKDATTNAIQDFTNTKWSTTVCV